MDTSSANPSYRFRPRIVGGEDRRFPTFDDVLRPANRSGWVHRHDLADHDHEGCADVLREMQRRAEVLAQTPHRVEVATRDQGRLVGEAGRQEPSSEVVRRDQAFGSAQLGIAQVEGRPGRQQHEVSDVRH